MRGDFHNSHGQRRRGTTSPPSNHGRPPDEGGRGAKSRPHRGARGRGAYGGGRGGVWPGGDQKTFDDGKAVTAQFVKLLEEKQDGDGGLYTEDDVSSAEEEDVMMTMLKMQDETMPLEEEQNLAASAPSATKGNVTEVADKKVYEYSDDGWGDPPQPLKATDAPVANKKGGLDGFTSSLPSVAAPPSTPKPAPVARAHVPSKQAGIPKDSLAGRCRNRRRSRGNESPPFIGYQGFGSSSPADRSKPPTCKNHTFLGASFGSKKHAFSSNPVVPLTWGPKSTPATPLDTSSSGVQEKREYSDDGWGISAPPKTVNSTAAHQTSTSSGSQELGSSSKPVEPISVTPAPVLPASSEINSFVPPDGGYKDCRYVSSQKYIPYAMRQIFYSRPDGSSVVAPANQPPYAPPPPPPDPHATLLSPVASFFVELLTNRQKDVFAGSSAFSSSKAVVPPPRPEPSPPAPSIKPSVVAPTKPARFAEQKTEPAVAPSKSQDIPILPNQENKSVTEKRGFRGCGVEIEQRLNRPATCAFSASKCAEDVAAPSAKKESPQRITNKGEFSDDGWDDPPPPPKARNTIVASRKVADDEEVWSTSAIVERKEQPDSPRTFRRNLKIVRRERDGGYDYVHPQEISEEILLTRGFETLNPAAFSQETRCRNQEKKRGAEKEGSGSGGISKIGSNSIGHVKAPSVKKDTPQGVTEGAPERFDKLKPKPVVAPSKTQDLSRFLNQEMEQMTEKEGSGSFGISNVASNFADDVMAPSAKNEPIQTVSLTDIKPSPLTDPYPTAELDDRIVFVPFNFPTGALVEDFFADLKKKGITVVRSGPIVVVPENFPTGPLIDSFFEDLKKKGLTVVTTSSAQGQSEPCSSALPNASATSVEFKSSSKPTPIAVDPTPVTTTPAAPEISKSENISSESEGFRSSSNPPSIARESTPVTTTSAAPEIVNSRIPAEEHKSSDDGWGTSAAPETQPEWMNNCTCGACGLPIRALFGKDCCSVLAIANATTLPTKPRWPQRKPKTQKTAPPKIITKREYSDDGWGDTPLPKSTDSNAAPQNIAVLPQWETPKTGKSTPTQPLTFTKATVRNKDGSLKAGSQVSSSIRPATGGFGTSISSSSTSIVAPRAKKNPVHESGYLPPFLRSAGSLRRAPVSAKRKVSSKPSSSSTFGIRGGSHGFGSYSAPASNAAVTAVKNVTSVSSASTSFGPGFGGVGVEFGGVGVGFGGISPSSISAGAKKNSVYQGGFTAPFQRASESLGHTSASAKPKVSSKPSIGSGFGGASRIGGSSITPASKPTPTNSFTVNPIASVSPKMVGFGGRGFGISSQSYADLKSTSVAVKNVASAPSNRGFGPPFHPPVPNTLPTTTAGPSHRAPVSPAVEESSDFSDMDRSGFIISLMNNEPMRSLIQTNYPDLYETIINHITNGVIVALNIT